MMQYTVVFSEEDFHVLSGALVELPYKVAAPLIQKINEQINAQQRAVSEQEAQE